MSPSCDVMPPRTMTRTRTPIAKSPSRTIAAPAALGTRWRCSMPTRGIATVATIVPATTGPTIVFVVPSSQRSAARSAKTPTRSHAVRPRSRSQRGGANTVVNSSSSTAPITRVSLFVNRVALVPFVSAQAHRFRPPSAEARCRTHRWDTRHPDDEPFGRTGRVPAIAKSRAVLMPAPFRCLDVA